MPARVYWSVRPPSSVSPGRLPRSVEVQGNLSPRRGPHGQRPRGRCPRAGRSSGGGGVGREVSFAWWSRYHQQVGFPRGNPSSRCLPAGLRRKHKKRETRHREYLRVRLLLSGVCARAPAGLPTFVTVVQDSRVSGTEPHCVQRRCADCSLFNARMTNSNVAQTARS